MSQVKTIRQFSVPDAPPFDCRSSQNAAPSSVQEAPISDETLLERFQRGDERSFESLVRRYERELFVYLVRMTGDRSLAEDVFQNTFLQIHLKRSMYQTGRPARPWIYTIATNQAIDAIRRRGRRQSFSLDRPLGNDRAGSLGERMAGSDLGPVDQAQANERRGQMRLAIDQLAAPLKTVVLLSYFQGMKYQEIAEVLRIPVGTVKSRLHTALRRLGELWTRRDETDTERCGSERS